MLERCAKASRVTKSQLIREAIELVYLRTPDAATTLRALDASAGAWRRREPGETYVERARSGRLARLHRADEP